MMAMTWMAAALAVALASDGGRAATAVINPPAAVDYALILPGAPTAGSPRDQADRAIFRRTRALAGTPRWALAQADADFSLAALMGDFSCAAGVDLDPARAPALAGLMRRLAPDIAAAIFPAKSFYRRRRPYLIDPGAICVPRSTSLDQEFDYPSGHAVLGWSAGLLLAAIAPDRASAILDRARAYGESRVVCGVHNASAVEAGRLLATAIFAARLGDPGFRANMDGARAELAHLRAMAAPPSAACQAQTPELLATPW